MDDTKWYVRFRGKVSGPYDTRQLQALRTRGQFSRTHEVSSDLHAWQPAGTLSMFASTTSEGEPTERPQSAQSSSQPPMGLATAEKEWFYAHRGKQDGPVRFSTLQLLAASGALQQDDLVWESGSPAWVPARGLLGLSFPSPAPVAATPTVSVLSTQAIDSQPSTSGLAVASFVLGLLVCVPIITSLMAVVFGGIAIVQVDRSRGRLAGKGLAVAGLILGIIGLIIWVAWYLLFFLAIFGHPAFSSPAFSGKRADAGVTAGLSSSARLDSPPINLSSRATAEEVSDAYRSRVFHINVTWTEQRFVGSSQASCSGSGILVANDNKHGLIVTNRHVLDPGLQQPGLSFRNPEITVENPLLDASLNAQLTALHSREDLALLIVQLRFEKPSGLVVAAERSIRQGEDAIAIGHPLGLTEPNVTKGIISSKSNGMILTTAPLGHGNSGGPLILCRGGLLAGINTAVASPELAQNLNLAIPAEEFVRSLQGGRQGEWNWHGDKQAALQLAKLVLLGE